MARAVPVEVRWVWWTHGASRRRFTSHQAGAVEVPSRSTYVRLRLCLARSPRTKKWRFTLCALRVKPCECHTRLAPHTVELWGDPPGPATRLSVLRQLAPHLASHAKELGLEFDP